MSQVPDGVVAPAAMTGAIVRRAGWPTVVALAGCTLVGGWARGADGLLGGLVGSLLVVAFFGLDLVVMRATARMEPVVTFGLVMLEYVGKIIALAVFLAAFASTTAFDTRVMAITLGVGTVVFLGAMAVAFARMKTYATDPEDRRRGEGSSRDEG